MRYGEALQLMHEHVKSDALRKHLYAVEDAMRFYAKHFNEDEEKWAVAGVLHDFDYEEFPDLKDHPFKGVDLLRSLGVQDDITEAILGHADHTSTPRTTLMAKALYACDELCGFVNACAVIRPQKILDLEVSSVKKKLKDKAFARNVSREDILKGMTELGIEEATHIANVIASMRNDAQRLGLLP